MIWPRLNCFSLTCGGHPLSLLPCNMAKKIKRVAYILNYVLDNQICSISNDLDSDKEFENKIAWKLILFAFWWKEA
ncbi:hypothetical protein BpHYR1_001460 [Brachionus plicatilis]|uniref:Uncharacterized protein n=1 Tax=Brachionus plicatilis TaxID=10195 RepID=A0A3M7P377_BRAPC|nr:hypothetical protein BpHYR1_001460 [Brachionus plicatilis]